MAIRLGLAGVAALAGAVALVLVVSEGSNGRRATLPATAGPTAHPATPTTGRLVVLTRTLPAPSSGSHLNAQLVSGSVPTAGSGATVLDDLDCAPDAAGISHCRNPLVLADGRRVEVIHPHSMAVVPCLTAGEQVRLVWR